MASALPHLLLQLVPTLTQAQSNVSLGQSLPALDDNSSWINSPSGDFAFGFRRLEGEEDPFVLAIWFAKVPNKTIVWTANNGYRVPRDSKVELTTDGKLVLKAFRGWMYGGLKTRIDLLTGNRYGAYYVTDTPNESGNQVVFNESGYIYMQMKNGSISNLTPANIVPSTEFYYRGTLNFDGVFVQYSHPKTSHGNESWTPMSFIPNNICLSSYSQMGSGPCGFNSYCKLREDKRPSCGCPPGFSLFDPSDQFSGCKQQYVQECEQGGLNAMDDQFKFEEIINADWPLSDFEQLTPCSEYACRRSCLSDCYCVVAIFAGPKDGGGSCWKKKLPLSNGKLDEGVDRLALFKVLKSNSSSQYPPHPEPVTEKNNEETLILSILLGCSTLFNFLFVAAISLIVFYMYHKKLLKLHQVPSPLETNLQSFSYRDLEEATHGFKEELGRGAFGIVYKGLLPLGSRNHVAVKKLDKMVQEGEKEFKTENEEEAILVDWAYDCYKDGRVGKLVEDDEEARSDMKMVEKLVMVAIWCIQDEPSLRPSMRKVTLMLEGVVEVSAPPCPFFFSSIS
ncbi:hypothetical protein HHK36_017694 [Tetracentron sinense]|uniref:Uncharacterized protein n=1 Tax=Tetracentron sinense TaxID=13715 RepID=A0A834Z392_TETSI|nr:hypothetical protein HHK36_017694 [Tetracentron sinense]